MHAILRPAWAYECASGPKSNPARYQTILRGDGWRILTPAILDAHRWGVREFVFHLPHGRDTDAMDFDALIRAGERGRDAQRLAESFDNYVEAILGALDEAVVTVYLGTLLCDSMEELLAKSPVAWTDRVHTVLDRFLHNDRVNIAIDMSSGLERSGHPGYGVLRMIESIKRAQGRRLYIEGVPVPSVEPASSWTLGQHAICQEPNWTTAVVDRGEDWSRIGGEITRWFSGHFKRTPKRPRANSFDDDPMRFLADVASKGHRLMTTHQALFDTFGAKNFNHFQQIATDAAAKETGP